jgi:hypothetical protein
MTNLIKYFDIDDSKVILPCIKNGNPHKTLHQRDYI